MIEQCEHDFDSDENENYGSSECRIKNHREISMNDSVVGGFHDRGKSHKNYATNDRRWLAS